MPGATGNCLAVSATTIGFAGALSTGTGFSWVGKSFCSAAGASFICASCFTSTSLTLLAARSSRMAVMSDLLASKSSGAIFCTSYPLAANAVCASASVRPRLSSSALMTKPWSAGNCAKAGMAKKKRLNKNNACNVFINWILRTKLLKCLVFT